MRNTIICETRYETRIEGIKMSFIKTIAVAFSMFSAIPMPQFEWNEKSTRYMMCAFPLVGAVCGCGLYLWYIVAGMLEVSNILLGVGVALIPIIITGGVHMDGYCDTMDARSSHADREKKLEILSDPHIGAFGVMAMMCYLLIYVGVASEITWNLDSILCMTGIFIMSRCFSARSIASLTCAKHTGLAHAFSDMASKKRVKLYSEIWILLLLGIQVWLNPIRGGAIAGMSLVIYFWWKSMITKEFGGMTGDLTGYLVQKMELYLLIVVMLIQ